jgi:predicted RNA-binding protein with PIN domain
MHYLLDGNNILKSTPEFLQLANGDFVKAQYELVARTAEILCGKGAGNFACIFFDGMGLNYKFRPPPNTKIVFSKEKTADSFITGEIKRLYDFRMQREHNGSVVVVSDDREIREAVRIFDAISWRTAEFTAKLFRATGKKTHPHFKPIEKIISSAHREKITEELKKYYREKNRI